MSVRLPRKPVSKLSSPRTCSPRATRACARCDPINPAAPVMRYRAKYLEYQRALRRKQSHLLDITLRIELLAGRGTRHVTNLAEYRTLAPRPVELAQHRPRDPGIPIRIAPIQ